jgi:trk system potassium uptake protein TrkA
MKSMLIIGAGEFGKNLARKLMSVGNEVLIIDVNEEEINKIAPEVTRAQVGDCMDKGVLSELGVRNFDICFVCISQNFQSSLEITSLLKEQGAVHIVAKSDSENQTYLLKKVGADEVVYPEKDMADRTAMRYSMHGAFDYIELSPEYAIVEAAVPSEWTGQSIRELNVRLKHRVNILGLRNERHIDPVITADHLFAKGDRIIISGEKDDISKLLDK